MAAIYQPEILYHNCCEWVGGDLLPLAVRLGHDRAVAEFLARWPLCSRRQAETDVDLVYLIDGPHPRGQGDVVLAIDAAQLDIEWHMDADEADGGWVTDRVPAAAIIGRIDDPAVAAEIARREG